MTVLGPRPVKLALAGGHLARASEQTSGEAEERQEAPRGSEQALVTSREPLGPAVPTAKHPWTSQFPSQLVPSRLKPAIVEFRRHEGCTTPRGEDPGPAIRILGFLS